MACLLQHQKYKEAMDALLAGTGLCPIFHRNGEKHTPANCPLLVELNFKLVRGPPPAAAAAPAPAPSGHVTVASPSPGGSYVVADAALASGLSGTVDIPLELVATVADKSTTWGMIFIGKAMNMMLTLQALLPFGITLTTLLPFTLLAFMQLLRPLHISQFLKILHQCALRLAHSCCPLFPWCVALSSRAVSARSLHTCLLLPVSQALIAVSLSQTQALLIICFWTSPLSFLTSW